jgi:hypothetical protein
MKYINKPENANTKTSMLRIQKNQDADSMKIMNDFITKIVEDERSRQIAVIAFTISNNERLIDNGLPTRLGGKYKQANTHQKC